MSSDKTDPEERWVLMRGQRDPYTYPFRGREEAEDFALDHGMLDWRAERNDDPKKEHTPICARCKESWPCEHQQLDHKASLILSVARNTCHRCGKDIGGIAIRIASGGPLGEDVAYHGRKGPCLSMARRELVRLGRVQQLAEFDADLRHRDEDLARRRAWREAKAEAKRLGLTGAAARAFRMDAA